METWLTNCGLQQFAQRSIEEGYDDPALIPQLNQAQVEAWATAVGMRGGHQVKLVQQWKQITAAYSTPSPKDLSSSYMQLPPDSPSYADVELTVAPPFIKAINEPPPDIDSHPSDTLVKSELPDHKSSVASTQPDQRPVVPTGLPFDLQQQVDRAQYPSFGRSRPVMVPKSKSLRRQLVCAFVPLVVVTFGVVILAAGVGLWATKQQAVSRSREALQNQVADSSGAFIRDAGQAFENRLLEGVAGFLLPMVHTYADATTSRLWPYSFSPPVSFADTSQYVAGIPVVSATDVDDRYPGLVSPNASSIFIHDQEFNLANLWASNSRTINNTAHIDRMVASFYRTHPEWQAGYIGTQTKVYRYFPGFLSDKETTNYDPTSRQWYSNSFVLAAQTVSRTTSPLQSLLDDVYITAPYASYSLGSYMISLSHALYHPDSACVDKGLTTCTSSIQDSGKEGVAAVQMYIKTIRALIDQLRTKQSGEAHLFVSGSGEVIASPQWGGNSTMLIGSVQILTEGVFTPSIVAQMTGVSGKVIVGDALIVYAKVIQSRFTLVMVNSLSQISAPIDDQIMDLTESANLLLGVAIGVGIASMITVMLVVWLVSAIVVRPLQAIAADSARISGNIGSSKMEAPEDTKIFVGEVNQLRVRFNNMLKGYIHKREQPDTFIRSNPFYQSKQLPAVTIPGSQQECAQALLTHNESKPSDSELVLAEPTPVTWRNRMKTVLGVGVSGPILVGVLIVIFVVSFQLSAKSEEWVQPVREAMISQEVAALPVRTTVLQQVVTSLFRRAGSSLYEFHQHAEDVWNAAHVNQSSPLSGQILAPYPLFYVPQSRAGAMPGFLPQIPYGGLDFDPRFPGMNELKANFQISSFYQNQNSGYLNQPGYSVPQFSSSNDPVLQLQSDMSHIDDFCRTLYFSNDQILALNLVDETYETFRQFPYRSKETFPTWQGQCLALGEVYRTGYTPICRNWYVAAKQNQYTDNWTPVYTSASTGYVMITASRAMHDANGVFVGVTAVDYSLDPLNYVLRQAKLYDKGYAYVVDHTGNAVLHPSMNFADTKPHAFIDFELQCGSDNERAAYAANIVPVIITATSINQSTYMRCGEMWYISWAPIDGTPYVLVLTMPHSDLTKQADDLASSLNSTLAGMTAGWVVATVIALLMSLWYAAKLSRRFASSLEGLSDYLAELHQTNYAADMRSDLPCTSYELEQIAETIRELLVALRFGNPSFATGDREKEYQNYLLALEIVNRNQSHVGVGIVQNNIGNTARLCSEANNLKNAQQPLDASIQCALVQVRTDGLKAYDTLGQRLFNLGLLALHENNILLALKIFSDVLIIHQITRNGEVMTRYSYSLSQQRSENRLQPDGKIPSPPQIVNQEVKFSNDLPPPAYQNNDEKVAPEHAREYVVSQWMQIFASQGLALLTAGPTTSACVAMACLAMSEHRALWCIWALRNIPDLSVFLLCNLAVCACQAGPEICEVIDPIMREQPQVEWIAEYPRMFKVSSGTKGNAGPRNFLFCLDVSGSMAGGRLKNCKEAAHVILSEHCKQSDYVSLVTFGSVATLVVPLQPYSEVMSSALQNLRAEGKTAFYDALKFLLKELSNHRSSRTSWLIALTDGDDNCSSVHSFSSVIATLREKKINVAIITVGALADLSLQRVEDLCLAARAGGGEGKHFVAQNTAEISAAFAKVSLLMADASLQMWQAL